MIDLHCHTNVSDNSFSVEEVIAIAKQNGVTHLAVTDHDTTDGLPRAMQIGKRLGVEIIPGIEISAFDYKRNRCAHILGLFIEPGHKAIASLCEPLVEERQRVAREMVKKVKDAGYDISWEDVERLAAGSTGVYKQHIMHALLDNGYTDRIYGELYHQLFSKGGEGRKLGIAYVPVHYVDVHDAIGVIEEAGGLPVLAHPGQFNNFAAVEEWVDAGLVGIEVKHPLHGPKEEARARELAVQFDLVQTGGSDFHGFYSDTGASIGSKSVGPECMEQLKNLLMKRRG